LYQPWLSSFSFPFLSVLVLSGGHHAAVVWRRMSRSNEVSAVTGRSSRCDDISHDALAPLDERRERSAAERGN